MKPAIPNPENKSTMNSTISSFRRARAFGNRRGIALLLVLTMLLLLSLMIVGLLISAQQEVATAKSYSDSSDVRSLSDLTANFVISQIAQATNQTPNIPANNDNAWISQPGLLRTFSPSGQVAAYKLYSSYNMIESSSYDPGSAATVAAEVPPDWWSQAAHPNEFVDLNQPITLPLKAKDNTTLIGDNKVYPIVDPNAVPTNSYPADVDGVEGFSYDASTLTAPPGTATTPPPNPLPMPVRWIYLTPDGQFLPATDPNYKKATARIAFWADDESTKVNLNTAAGGVPFDAPVFNTREDHMLARTQPVAQEYNRIAGEPATTSLAPLFPQLRAAPYSTDPQLLSRAAAMLTPRIAPAGTINPSAAPAPGQTLGSDGGALYAWVGYNRPPTVGVGDAVILDTDRLFASVDEVQYDSAFPTSGAIRTQNSILTTNFNPPNNLTVQKQVEQLSFFATVNSNAPELNLFNRPRISLWPFNTEMVSGAPPATIIPANGTSDPHNEMIPEDQLIRMATEYGGSATSASDYSSHNRKRFYFERNSAWDPQADWTGTIQGGSKLVNSTDASHAGEENRALFTYLQAMTNKAIPASTKSAPSRINGSSLQAKFGQNRDQILTEMWDYIRSNVDNANQAYQPVGYNPYSFPQNTSNPALAVQGTSNAAYNDVAPLQVVQGGQITQGFGHYPVPVEFILQFYNAGEYPDPTDATKFVRRVRLVFLMHFMNPVTNTPANSNCNRFQVQVTGSTFKMQVNGSGHGIAAATGIRAMGAGGWLAAGTDVPLNFPSQAGGAHRTIDWVDSLNVGAGNGMEHGYGGSLGISYPYRTSASPAEKQSDENGVGGIGKLLSNLLNHGDFFGSDVASLSRFTNAATRDDIYYPFVGDVMEFQIPFPIDPITKLPDKTLPFKLRSNDYFNNVTFTGDTDMTITVYPGLLDSSENSPDVSKYSACQTPTGNNYIYQIKNLTIANCLSLPLPRPNGSAETAAAPAPGFEDYNNRTPGDSENEMQANDVYRSYVLDGDPSNGKSAGDVRLLTLVRDIPASWYVKHTAYDDWTNYYATYLMPYSIRNIAPVAAASGETTAFSYPNLGLSESFSKTGSAAIAQANSERLLNVQFSANGQFRTASPITLTTARIGSSSGDFSFGPPNTDMGALVVGADIGPYSQGLASGWNKGGASGGILDNNYSSTESAGDPYYAACTSRAVNFNTANSFSQNVNGTLFSALRQIASPVQFGTLPARPLGSASPWETLLFNPNPAGGAGTHRGWIQLPRDHFLLDLFYMPVVEPYAITQDFATAGKLNLNYQIAPFTYIKRQTGMYALLDTMTQRWAPGERPNYNVIKNKGSVIIGVPDTDAGAVGSGGASPVRAPLATALGGPNNAFNKADSSKQYRYFVDIPQTLTQFDARFAINDPFVSPSEICEMPLVVPGQTAAGMTAWWSTRNLVGTDKRNAPYNSLYPRVTTRSNTFKVHFWVQTLNPKGLAQANTPANAAPIVTGEYRGSEIVERYLDPNVTSYGASSLPASVGEVDTDYPFMNTLYKYRKVQLRQFAP